MMEQLKRNICLVDEQVDVTNMKIKFDVTKTHITEKAMDIKIY